MTDIKDFARSMGYSIIQVNETEVEKDQAVYTVDDAEIMYSGFSSTNTEIYTILFCMASIEFDQKRKIKLPSNLADKGYCCCRAYTLAQEYGYDIEDDPDVKHLAYNNLLNCVKYDESDHYIIPYNKMFSNDDLLKLIKDNRDFLDKTFYIYGWKKKTLEEQTA